MNVKELIQLLNLTEDIIDAEKTKVCINDSRDGCKSFPEARATFTKDDDGNVILAFGY